MRQRAKEAGRVGQGLGGWAKGWDRMVGRRGGRGSDIIAGMEGERIKKE